MRYFEHFNHRGTLGSVDQLSNDDLISIRASYAQLERADVTFAVGSSLFPGDYFEFGCLDLHSFLRTMNVCHIFEIEKARGEKKTFYGFDIFGDLTMRSDETRERHKYHDEYFGNYDKDVTLEDYYGMIRENGVFVDQCELIQGYFNETFTPEFVEGYRETGRRAGFVFVDCNVPESYEAVFEHLADILRNDAWIYIDEYLEIPPVTVLFEDFRKKLEAEKGWGTVYAKSAGGMGALFRCYPLGQDSSS